jgi:NADH:ubiquinone oxidoreductase subunit
MCLSGIQGHVFGAAIAAIFLAGCAQLQIKGSWRRLNVYYGTSNPCRLSSSWQGWCRATLPVQSVNAKR